MEEASTAQSRTPATPTTAAAMSAADQEQMAMVMAFYNETVNFEKKIGIIIPTIFALIILIGVVGNVLVVVVALHRQMRNSTNTLIIGLAISDLMFLLLCIPFTAIDYAMPIWVFPEWTCSMINYFQHISAYFSVWTLTLMALDRFLAVCFPVDSMTLRSTRNTVIVMMIVYAIIFVSQIPIGLMHGIFYYEFIVENRSTCAIVSIADNSATVAQARGYFLTFNLFGYMLPLGITCVLYYFMLSRLWRTPRPGTCNSINSSIRSRPETVKAKRKVTRLVLCVVIIWAVCWLPLNVCFFFSGMAYPDTLVLRGGKIMVVVQIASQVLAYTNSCLNPILYALMSDNFRKGFVRVLSILCKKVSCGLCCTSEPKSMSRMEITNFHTTQTTGSLRPSRNAVAGSQVNPSELCSLLYEEQQNQMAGHSQRLHSFLEMHDIGRTRSAISLNLNLNLSNVRNV
ncbi:unnamed protein product, partial [Mesorhabditis spiculigera]